ncbi:hypothetical protein ACFLUS_03990 [Chloroflexota bacterium]
MIQFLNEHATLFQAIASLIAIVTAIIVIVAFLLNKHRINRNNEHELKILISTFNKNNLQSLKDARLIVDEKDCVQILDLELLAKDKKAFEQLVDKYPGTYEKILEIVQISSEHRFYRNLIRIVVVLVAVAVVGVLAVTIWSGNCTVGP